MHVGGPGHLGVEVQGLCRTVHDRIGSMAVASWPAWAIARLSAPVPQPMSRIRAGGEGKASATRRQSRP
jgi:hypothetical protein